MVISKSRTTDGLVSNGGRFWGFSVVGTAGDSVLFNDGSATGSILGGCKLTAEKTSETVFFAQGVSAPAGVWVEVVSGTPTIVIYFSN